MSLLTMLNSQGYLTRPFDIARNLVWHYRGRASDQRHVFVVGAPRSGTTLVQLLIGSQPAFFPIPDETGIFTRQNLFLIGRGYGVNDSEVTSRLLSESSSKVEFFEAVADHLLHGDGSKRIVEKTPGHLRQLAYLMAKFPKAYFVNVVRDGRDCYCSAIKCENIPQSKSLEKFAKFWSKSVSSRMNICGDDRIIDVRYEDIVQNTNDELARLIDFLGGDFHEENIRPEIYLNGDDRHLHAKFSKLAEMPNESSVGRWKTELTAEENEVFCGIAQKELIAFNYELHGKAAQ